MYTGALVSSCLLRPFALKFALLEYSRVCRRSLLILIRAAYFDLEVRAPLVATSSFVPINPPSVLSLPTPFSSHFQSLFVLHPHL